MAATRDNVNKIDKIGKVSNISAVHVGDGSYKG